MQVQTLLSVHYVTLMNKFLLYSKPSKPRVIQASVQVGLGGFPQGENLFKGRAREQQNAFSIESWTENKCELKFMRDRT